MFLHENRVFGTAAAGHDGVDAVATLVHGFNNMAGTQRNRLDGRQIMQGHIFRGTRQLQPGQSTGQRRVGPW
ncbi:hypothetical protein D3C87_2029540 [compost metagenome]